MATVLTWPTCPMRRPPAGQPGLVDRWRARGCGSHQGARPATRPTAGTIGTRRAMDPFRYREDGADLRRGPPLGQPAESATSWASSTTPQAHRAGHRGAHHVRRGRGRPRDGSGSLASCPSARQPGARPATHVLGIAQGAPGAAGRSAPGSSARVPTSLPRPTCRPPALSRRGGQRAESAPMPTAWRTTTPGSSSSRAIGVFLPAGGCAHAPTSSRAWRAVG